jgi:hypothetical protein
MEWIYEFVANIFGLSQEWAELLVQLSLVLGVIILMIALIPWAANRFKRELSFEDRVRNWLYRGYVQYWHRWGSDGLSEQEMEIQTRILDAGVDWILEIHINQNIKKLGMGKPIGFFTSDIRRVVAAWAGYIRNVRRGNLYRWIVELKDGRYIYMRGWFDPSRHEERTLLFTCSADTAEEATEIEMRRDKLVTKGCKKKDLDVIMDQEVCDSLLDQIRSGEREWSGFRWGLPMYAA